MERRQSPSLQRGGSVSPLSVQVRESLSFILRGGRLLLYTDERVSFLSLCRGDSLFLLYIEEGKLLLHREERVLLSHVERRDSLSLSLSLSLLYI